MKLQVSTRGESSTKGKTRVFIASYSRRSRSAAHQICQWILNVRNYAVYYPDNEDYADSANHDADLLQMQCVIVPVFAEGPLVDEVSVRDYQFARDHHIPVATLLMSDSDTSQFYAAYGRVFGTLQLLKPFRKQADGTSFDQELIQYLEGMTSDDVESYRIYQQEGYFPKEMEQAILDEFRGRVFISYRKKNRKIVEQLVRFFHSNDALLDIMLWFDDFLAAGHSYYDEIRDNIQHADLFLLIVTPDIFEEGNYVLTQEYPLAVACKKTILAFEAISTEEETLRRYYPETAHFFRQDQLGNLRNALNMYFQVGRGDAQALTGRRAYFLGKAYFSGKWVETDRERGLRLLQKAAEDDFIPAMLAMASMYKYGNGVSPDPERQLMWQQRIAELIERKKEAGGVPGNRLKELMESYEAQGDVLLREQRFEEAEQSYRNMLRASRELRDRNAHSALHGVFADYEMIAYRKIANACMYQDHISESRRCLEQAIRVDEERRDRSLVLGDHMVICSVWITLGRLERSEGNAEKAIASYQKALGYLDQSAGIPGVAAAGFMNHCEVLESLGWLYMESGRREMAREYFEKFCIVAEAFAKEYPSLDAKKCCMQSSYAMGQLLLKEGETEESLSCQRRAVELAESIAEEEGSSSAAAELLFHLRTIAVTLYTRNMFPEAYRYLQQAEILIQKGGDDRISLEDLTVIYSLLGNVLYRKNQFANARRCYKNSLRYQEQLYEKKRDLQSLADLGTAYYKTATAHAYTDDWKSIKKAMEIFGALSVQIPGNLQYASLEYKIRNLYRERRERVEIHRRRVQSWAAGTLSKAEMLDQQGLFASESISLKERILADLTEMAAAFAGREYGKIPRIADVLTQCLGTGISADEMRRYAWMQAMLDVSSADMMSKVPESIVFSTALIKELYGKSDDYHEEYPFEIRILFSVIGEWVLDLLDAGEEPRARFVEYIDLIDLHIEDMLA